MGCLSSNSRQNKEEEKTENLNYGVIQRQKSAEKGIKVAKICILGESSVGKSSILYRHINNIFKEDGQQPTIGGSYIDDRFELDNKQKFQLQQIKLQPSINLNQIISIWDTAGQEQFKSLNSIFYQGSDGAFLVFDLTNSESFKNVEYWAGQLQENVIKTNFILFLVGNKSDMKEQRIIEQKQAEEYANQLYNKYKFKAVKYYETSAKNGQNIHLIFKDVATQLDKFL